MVGYVGLWLLIVCSVSAAIVKPPYGLGSIASAEYPTLSIRHCDFDGFVTPFESGNDDFQFYITNALNNNPDGFSVQSVNYPDHYLAPDPIAPGRLGIVVGPNVDDASFVAVNGLSNPSYYSFQSLSQGTYKNYYITRQSSLSGGCAGNYQSPSGNLYLSTGQDASASTWIIKNSPPVGPVSVEIVSNNVTHTVNPLFMGCHSDSGYTHQPRGFYSQLIYGESFEELWNKIQTGASGSTDIDSNVPFNNKPSMNFTFTSGSGFIGLSNRGLGNEGLVFESNKNYEVQIFVNAPNGGQFTARIDNYETSTVLASKTIELNATSDWVELNFDLIPTGSTNCVGIAPNSDPNIDCGSLSNEDGHICVRCGGQFTIGLTQPGSINVGYVFVQPGTWGRYNNLPVLLSSVQTLKDLGITVIRQGGTFAQTIVWKDWRGPATQRPSMQLKWGASLVSGWGPFEMIDLCNSAGIEPIITLSEDQSAQDWADLVEYCYGGENTQWGAQRYADGHPSQYKVSIFELGNEQYNNNWVNQVQAMEAKAVSLGLAGTLRYMFPTNDGLNSADAQKAQSLGLPIPNIMPDIHVGAGGAIPVAQADFNALPNFHQSAINCETNAATHTLDRGLQEASDLNDWFNALPPLSDRLVARTASFCTSRSGHFDGFDQGISFFLPNMTWLQPPGYVHQMISNTWQPNGLDFNLKTWGDRLSFSTQGSVDGKTIVARFVNQNPTTLSITITISGGFQSTGSVQVISLSSNVLFGANDPSDPTRISPVKSSVSWSNGGSITVPANSFNIFVFSA